MFLLRSLLSVLLLPVVVTVLVPYILFSSGGTPGPDAGLLSPLRLLELAVGAATGGAGLLLVCVTVWQFAAVGRGTLAPWDPPRHLVVRGAYRYVRNPMISGVVLVLVGETALFGSVRLLGWAAAFLVLNLAYIPAVEERGLARRFGGEYGVYCEHVPRWVPRTRAWEPPWEEPEGRRAGTSAAAPN